MKLMRNVVLAAIVLVCLGAFAGAQDLTGAGSTFVNPVMQRWAADFTKANPGVKINYQSVGSGAGIQQVKNNTVDFGASDAVISDEQLKDMPAVFQIPESAGPVCITYNLPELQKPLRLTGPALAGIFMGTITNWNDPMLAKANPGVTLPNRPVLVAHRSDGSGTTNIFTNYLSAVSPDWKSKVGAGTVVNWPVGLGGKGSDGVSGDVKGTSGAIGYVELTYATQNKLPVAEIQNMAGQFIAPSAESTSAAIDAFKAQLAADVRNPIVNASGAKSYPIAGLTYLIVPRSGTDAAKRAALRKFVTYVLSPAAQQTAATLSYAPIPASILALDEKMAAQIK